jgi:hypothetical protein
LASVWKTQFKRTPEAMKKVAPTRRLRRTPILMIGLFI